MNFKLLEEWRQAKYALDVVKEKESRLRKEVLAEFFKELKPEGTTNMDLQDKWILKAVTGLDYKVTDAPKLLTLAKTIKKLDLVKTKYELSITPYRTLTPEEKLLVDACLLIKPSSTQLELVPPKGAA